MDVFEQLKNYGDKLLPEDLDFLEAEIDTNEEYTVAYRFKCKSIIRRLRCTAEVNVETLQEILKNAESQFADKEDDYIPEDFWKRSRKKIPKPPVGLFMDVSELAPEENNPAAEGISPADVIFKQIKALRESNATKKDFIKFFKQKDNIDAAFIDAYFPSFKDREIDAFISSRPFGEELLEKYFGALNPKSIAIHQPFSESFFMKHFNQLDTVLVLTRGVNPWREKAQRSKQLDVFLRLKGIMI